MMITSAQNPQIKHLSLLMEKSRLRKEEQVFVLEGARELGIALQSGYSINTLYYCPDLVPDPFRKWDLLPSNCTIQEIDAHLFQKLAYRGTTEGVIALMEERPLTLKDLPISDNPLIIVLESVEKPGNLGAILRTADAVGATAVLVCEPLTDLYNPNTIRASLGCIFSVPTVACASDEAHRWLEQQHIQIVAANCQSTYDCYHCRLDMPTAFVMGTEDKGLGPFWREKATVNTKIPMMGKIDSLNVSVATAVLCYEALRQRQNH